MEKIISKLEYMITDPRVYLVVFALGFVFVYLFKLIESNEKYINEMKKKEEELRKKENENKPTKKIKKQKNPFEKFINTNMTPDQLKEHKIKLEQAEEKIFKSKQAEVIEVDYVIASHILRNWKHRITLTEDGTFKLSKDEDKANIINANSNRQIKESAVVNINFKKSNESEDENKNESEDENKNESEIDNNNIVIDVIDDAQTTNSTKSKKQNKNDETNFDLKIDNKSEEELLEMTISTISPTVNLKIKNRIKSKALSIINNFIANHEIKTIKELIEAIDEFVITNGIEPLIISIAIMTHTHNNNLIVSMNSNNLIAIENKAFFHFLAKIFTKNNNELINEFANSNLRFKILANINDKFNFIYQYTPKEVTKFKFLNNNIRNTMGAILIYVNAIENLDIVATDYLQLVNNNEFAIRKNEIEDFDLAFANKENKDIKFELN